ncbi:MAG: hypothetical protein AAFS03_08220, partial [Pseudomonadota bacterium]
TDTIRYLLDRIKAVVEQNTHLSGSALINGNRLQTVLFLQFDVERIGEHNAARQNADNGHRKKTADNCRLAFAAHAPGAVSSVPIGQKLRTRPHGNAVTLLLWRLL